MAVLEDFATNPLLRAYCFYNAILVFKIMFVAVYTSMQRIKHKAFVNPEDAKAMKVKPTSNDNVERVRRAHLNDLENIPIYFVACFGYICTNPSVMVAVLLMRIFTAARIVHTIVYAVMPLPQPSRGLAFGVGFLITAYMSAMTLMHFVL